MNDLGEPMPGIDSAGFQWKDKNQVCTIKVPASSANLGPGFDSLGVALNLYLKITAEVSEKWEVLPLSHELESFPKDENYFICQVAIKTAMMYKHVMPPLQLAVHSDIPLARGLGSSAAAIVSGIELADLFCSLHLTREEKLQIATQMEGHPDNVGACIYGGVVVGSQVDGEVDLTVLDIINFDPILIIPHQELLTETSRDALPEVVGFDRAVQASAISNQLIAALMTQRWELAGKMMAADLFHQPYRKALVPYYEWIQEKAVESGAFGVALSGAGPSVLCLAKPGMGDAVAERLRKELDQLEVHSLKIDRQGCQTSMEQKG